MLSAFSQVRTHSAKFRSSRCSGVRRRIAEEVTRLVKCLLLPARLTANRPRGQTSGCVLVRRGMPAILGILLAVTAVSSATDAGRSLALQPLIPEETAAKLLASKVGVPREKLEHALVEALEQVFIEQERDQIEPVLEKIHDERLRERVRKALETSEDEANDEQEKRALAERILQQQQEIFRLFGSDPSTNPARGLPSEGRFGDRLEIPQRTADLVRARMRSVALLVTVEAVDATSDYPLRTLSLEEKRGLCPRLSDNLAGPYPFRNEHVVDAPITCTASLVAGPPVRLLTARHCLRNFPNVDDLVAVFDYYVAGTENRPIEPVLVPLVGQAEGATTYRGKGSADDWAILPLPNGVQLGDRPAIPLGGSRLSPEDRLYTLHHPLAMPLKFTPDGRQQGPASEGLQVRAILDIFEGSSGAPVFSASSDNLVGIVQASSGGVTDLRLNGECSYINICTRKDIDQGCNPVLVGTVSRSILEQL